MAKVEQIPRNCFAWLLLALIAVIIPHSLRLPVWESVALVLVLIWRVQLYRGVWTYPNRLVKTVLTIGSAVGLFLQYGTLYGLDPMVALLMISIMLKALEMNKKRDVIVVIFLGFFTTSTQFLFSQTVFAFLYALLCLALLVAAQISLYQERQLSEMAEAFPMAGKIVLQSIPVMLILFLLFPRVGSLWAVPLPQGDATTGISDSMSPGDFSKLSKNGGKAFTASFDGDVPAHRDLYWRGLVLSHFDGRTWSPNRWGSYPGGELVDWVDSATSKKVDWRSWAVPVGNPVDYEIILEPTHQPWLFSLPLAELNHDETGITRNYTWIKKGGVSQRFRYRVESDLSYEMARNLPLWLRQLELQLPDDFNPRTVATARQWAQEESSTEALISRFLNFITREFTYTLEPPLLGEHTVDEFLWQSQRGFCEHFASSFVIFMRAAGVPARVVTGYQGGEKIEDFLQVSQADAHAWAEVWIRDRGWVRVDPTSAVAPSRIESGIRSVFPRSVNNPLSMEAYTHISLLNELRKQIDIWDYNWQRWVLNYDKDNQVGLLEKIFGRVSAWHAGATMVFGVALIIGLITAYYWWQTRPKPLPPGLAEFSKFCKKFKNSGVERHTGEGGRDFANRASSKFPQHKEAIEEITRLFERGVYAEDFEALKELKVKVKRFSLK